MAHGSREPEGPDDYQCSNCGRWYDRVGLSNHEDGCDLPEWADPLVPIRDPDDHPALGGDGLEESAEPDDVQEARTDGSGLGLSGPPETSSSEPSDATDDDGPDELECPECGDGLGVTDDELAEEFGAEGAVLDCSCGNRMRWSP